MPDIYTQSPREETRQVEKMKTEEHEVWVICLECGGKHKLFSGIGAPMYWCGDKLKILKVGDDVEYEDNAGINGMNRTVRSKGRFLGLPLRHWDLLMKTGQFPVE